jgi:DUF4097 and DUF4098 domain-containing protein YvlB
MFARYVTNTYEINDRYEKITIDAREAKVKIEPSNDGITELFCYEKKRMPYEFLIQDGTLVIKPKKSKWYNFLRIGIDRSEIRLAVPESVSGNISVKANVGCIDVRSITCDGKIDIQTNTGNVNLENVSCEDFESKGNTGSVSLNGFTAKKSITISRNTGKISLHSCTAPEIFVKTKTGTVCGKLPSNTVFRVRTNTGKIEIPNPPIGETVGARCEINTNTGSVKFE